MAYKLQEDAVVLPKTAASAIRAGEPVRGSASVNNQVVPVGTSNVAILGVAIATAASPGDVVAVQVDQVVIARAAASMGPNQLVGVGSTNGRLALVASGSQVVGESQVAAQDGDYFSVLLQPRQPVA